MRTLILLALTLISAGLLAFPLTSNDVFAEGEKRCRYNLRAIKDATLHDLAVTSCKVGFSEGWMYANGIKGSEQR